MDTWKTTQGHSGDALVVAIMQGNDLTNLASNDADFDRVPGLMRYVPV